MSRYAAQDRHHRRIGRTDQTKGNARHFKQIAMMQPPRFRQLQNPINDRGGAARA